ncbi:MAG: FAD-binding dehydrogenase [Verrucomicrobia bacterium]|nr:MAG: FAD-binding dehydrogenase [Verrucomicrobiota bacterium]
MIRSDGADHRKLKSEQYTADLTVVGGGMAGVCCAVTAARAGLKVALVQDRPVLGGNASSEVRLWILGASSHMGNNNRWAREGGVIDEILVENMYRNPEGNPLLVDTVLLEKVVSEPNLKLFLNTAVYELDKADPNTIRAVRAFCAQNSTLYEIASPLFCDASGDGIVGFLAGAAFRMGSEASSEFDEKFAPARPGPELLGSTIYFYSKDVGRPVKFIPPNYALTDITTIPRWRDFNSNDQGCRLWWIEWGGRLDVVHEAEAIKWELWKIVYGVWNHIKNSGLFPDAETLALEWVGTIPGKRESRRFEGDYILSQLDIVEQREHADAVSFGGWAIDLHPADGVFSEKPGCAQWHAKGVYQIPYRCLYSRNISNLFLSGRLCSVSHVAFGSTRVMATCAHNGQATGMAAVLCRKYGLSPRELGLAPHIHRLQNELLKTGQHIPGLRLKDTSDLARKATISASSHLKLSELPPNGEALRLRDSWAMLLPIQAGPVPSLEVILDVAGPTVLCAELRASTAPGNYTPDQTLAAAQIELPAGKGLNITLPFDVQIESPSYLFVCLMANENVSVWLSEQRITGVLSLSHRAHQAVTKSARQEPPPGNGIPSFEFWIPQRRPQGKNFALRIEPPIDVFGPESLVNGFARPGHQPNAWVADVDDAHPTVTLAWPTIQTIGRLELVFDTDYDHPMESVLMGHPERVMPFCVRDLSIENGRVGQASQMSKISNIEPATILGAGKADLALAGASSSEPVTTSLETDVFTQRTVAQIPGKDSPEDRPVLAQLKDNYHSRRSIVFDPPISTDKLVIRTTRPARHIPASIFEIRCYSPE